MSDLPPPPPFDGQPLWEPTGPGSLAEWPMRAGGFIADLVVFGVISFLVGLPARALGTAGVVAAGLIVSAVYFISQEGNGGQTIGKKLFSVAVVGEDMRPIGYSTAAVRWVVKYLLFQLMTIVFGLFAVLWVFADYLWPLWDPRSQTLHDKAARTLVVAAQR